MSTAQRKAKLAYWRRILKWNQGKLAKARGSDRVKYQNRIKQAQARIHDLRFPSDKPVPATGPDISNLQGKVDFKAIKTVGHSFVYLKAGEGDWTDPTLLDNVAKAKQANLHVGAYHFLRPKAGRTGGEEAQFFIRNLKAAGLGKGDLRPAADIEATKLNRTATIKYLQDFLAAVEFATGIKPVVYTYPSFPQTWPSWLSGYPLWLADYDGGLDIPKPWTAIVLHQYTDKGTTPGVSGHVDMNNTEDLRRVVA